MGFRSIINKLFQPKDVSKDKMDAALDEYIKTSQTQHQKVLSTANKLMKGKLLQQQAREITQNIKDLDRDSDDEEDEISLQDQIQQAIVTKFLGGGLGIPSEKKQHQDPLGLGPQDNLPIETSSQTGEGPSPIRQEVSTLLSSLSDDELQKLKTKFTK